MVLKLGHTHVSIFNIFLLTFNKFYRTWRLKDVCYSPSIPNFDIHYVDQVTLFFVNITYITYHIISELNIIFFINLLLFLQPKVLSTHSINHATTINPPFNLFCYIFYFHLIIKN